MTRVLRLTLVVVLAASAAPGCRREPADLRPDEAAAALKAEPTFTKRERSPGGRDLVAVVAVRRIGRSSTEVEFTWIDAPAAPGAATAVPRTSMALFRLQEDGRWHLATFFKLD